jgi:RNA polymerase sigma factor (sigma-70 family)
VFREEAGRITAWLVRILDDFSVAEDSVQDALVAALEQWPAQGIPECPRAWLQTVARRRAIDSIRREVRYREKLVELDQPIPQEPDNRLELIFLCCHPALAPDAQIALTLRAVCGLSTAEIASAFLVSEAALAQRIVRARRKIAAAGIPYRIPREDELNARLNQVLSVLYLMFNEGYLASGMAAAARRDIAEDAAWLAELMSYLFPSEPEALGLLALMRLHLARADARFRANGDLVLLRDQNRRCWDQALIARGITLIEQAGAMHKPGPYQLQAAIAACHAEAPSWQATDWRQILLLYEVLLELAPSPIGRLNRAVALRQVAGPAVALREVQALATPLDGYHLWHAVYADLLHELGQRERARAAELRALALTSNPAEQSLLRCRLAVDTE